jgi:hypothetical protein
MRSRIKVRQAEIKEKALASHSFKFLCQPTLGTFTKSHRLPHILNFVKEPNFANTLKTGISNEIAV